MIPCIMLKAVLAAYGFKPGTLEFSSEANGSILIQSLTGYES